MLQLVFGFVNAPLFATFLLGMFWKRTTGHGAFWGLLSGTFAAFIYHTIAITEGTTPSWIKGGALGQKLVFHSDMGKTFWMALAAWTVCMIVTMLISVLTKQQKSDEDLAGLVYSLTPHNAKSDDPWYKQPVTLGILVLLAALALNFIFA
jgi:SSS family solute:Na+ symporter